MSGTPLEKIRQRLMLVGAVLCFLVFVGFIWWSRGVARAESEQAIESAAQHAREATLKISQTLDKLVPVNIALSEDLTSGRLTKEDIPERLKRDKALNPVIFGLGVAYSPYSFDPNIRLYAPLYVNGEGGPSLVQIEDKYDYTEEGRDWYHLPLEMGPIWQEPHYGEASQAFLANFTTPFYIRDSETGENKPGGVVFSSMSLAQYREIADSLDLGEGYAFILSAAGVFVSHPDKDYVDKGMSIIQWAEASGRDPLIKLAKNVLNGRRAFAQSRDETGRDIWYFSEPIISTGWSVGVVMFKDHLVSSKPLMGNIPAWSAGAFFLLFTAGLLRSRRPASA